VRLPQKFASTTVFDATGEIISASRVPSAPLPADEVEAIRRAAELPARPRSDPASANRQAQRLRVIALSLAQQALPTLAAIAHDIASAPRRWRSPARHASPPARLDKFRKPPSARALKPCRGYIVEAAPRLIVTVDAICGRPACRARGNRQSWAIPAHPGAGPRPRGAPRFTLDSRRLGVAFYPATPNASPLPFN